MNEMMTQRRGPDLSPSNGHKHSMKITGTHLFKDKFVTQLVCTGCYQYVLVEHGWFQEPKHIQWPRST